MPPACCEGIDDYFNKRLASRELRQYRRRGPRRSSKKLIDALVAEGVDGRTLLDIGGGIGAIQHELFGKGLRSAVSVDASIEYLTAAQEEALWLKNRQHTSMYHGDFVDLAHKISSADIVTLDRVLCCYADLDALITASAAKAEHLYGLVYPSSGLLSRLSTLFFNGLCWLGKNQFRAHYHTPAKIRQLVSDAGLSETYRTRTPLWTIEVYRRSTESSPSS